MTKLTFLLSMLMFLVDSCSLTPRKAVTCSEIVEPFLLSVPFDALEQETGAAWIKANFPSADLYDVNTGPAFGWRQFGKEYLAVLGSDRKIVTSSLSPEPMIDEVIKCFGPPDLYSLSNLTAADGVGTRLSLWYPSRGLVFHYTGFNQKRVTRYDQQSLLNSVDIMKPGSISDLARQIYAEARAVEIVASAKAWPTHFVSIDLDAK